MIGESAIPAPQRVQLLHSQRHTDVRGWFEESWSAARLAEAGIEISFVQDNHSYSAHRGTVRGLHFQNPPFAQAKLVRCLRGSILDCVVDIRGESPTYGRHLLIPLEGADSHHLFIPQGFAHGFITLEPDTEVAYKVSAPYHGPSESGLIWNDPDLSIDWGIEPQSAILSAKDEQLSRFADLGSPFVYTGGPLAGLDQPVP